MKKIMNIRKHQMHYLLMVRRLNVTSSKEYLEYILEQLSELEDITHRAMMGEYIIYYRGKIIGGIYDDRFLVKPVKSAKGNDARCRYGIAL